MKHNPVGVSILTNDRRRQYLERALSSLFKNCCWRPFVIGIFDNGSTDNTRDFLQNLPEVYGVEWRVGYSDNDRGLSYGTSCAAALVKDCRYVLNLESDWELLSETESGVDKFWLHRGLELLQSGDADYLYLRRIMDEKEIMAHWWSQWMPRITSQRGEYLRCPGFWWSNNPHLRDNDALVEQGVLPFPILEGERKESQIWTQSEFQTKKPEKVWIHKWGLFVHDRPSQGDYSSNRGCGRGEAFGLTTCKYGLFKNGKDDWCRSCDSTKDFRDMANHENRYRAGETIKKEELFPLGDVAAFISTYDEGPFLENILRWLIERVNMVFVIESAETFFGSRKKTKRWTKRIVDKIDSSKIQYLTLESEPYDNPAMCEMSKRNKVMSIIQKAGYKWVWVVDADEAYRNIDAERLWTWFLQKSSDEKVRGAKIEWYTYWRSMNWQVSPRESWKAPIILRSDCRFLIGRNLEREDELLNVPSDICLLHHFSYSREPKYIKRKIETWSHAHQVLSSWFENVFLKWSPDCGMTNLHPTNPSVYKEIVRREIDLPECLQDHPWVGLDIIKDSDLLE